MNSLYDDHNHQLCSIVMKNCVSDYSVDTGTSLLINMLYAHLTLIQHCFLYLYFLRLHVSYSLMFIYVGPILSVLIPTWSRGLHYAVMDALRALLTLNWYHHLSL